MIFSVNFREVATVVSKFGPDCSKVSLHLRSILLIQCSTKLNDPNNKLAVIVSDGSGPINQWLFIELSFTHRTFVLYLEHISS